MELYSSVSHKSSALLTRSYSTSFSLSSRFFPKDMRMHVYAVYGLVRIADEIVDTYMGKDARELLDTLEQTTYAAIKRGFDTNPIVHSFAETARRYSIDKTLIAPFFHSMRIDLDPQSYDESLYKEYIHGSAEVIGLMCLKVFCQGNEAAYHTFEKGAAALGSAYQKVNFLRDLADDYRRLDRVYFPGVTFKTFNDETKNAIISDIEKDFTLALKALKRLPKSSRLATMTSYVYYQSLLNRLKATPIATLKEKRIRISNAYKIFLFIKVLATEGWKQQ